MEDLNTLFNRSIDNSEQKFLESLDKSFFVQPEDIEIKRDEETIKKEISLLQKEMRKYGNVKNCRRTTINEKMALKRKDIKRKIEVLKLELEDLQLEKDGKNARHIRDDNRDDNQDDE